MTQVGMRATSIIDPTSTTDTELRSCAPCRLKFAAKSRPAGVTCMVAGKRPRSVLPAGRFVAVE